MPITRLTRSSPIATSTSITSRFRTSYFYVSALLTLSAAVALLAFNAQAQTAEPVAPAATAAPQTQPVQQPGSAPKYTAQNIERAFGYIDANKDNQISREEATGFRGVAKHFDEADTNKDGRLSREEFENALNVSKPQ